ncbi:MAG: DUF5683 domain-containing protein [Flavobacteriaceae bacterium]
MKNKCFIVICFSLFTWISCAQQSGELKIEPIDSTATAPVKIDPLSPARAAFFSAVLPGLGQIHNKHYWKVPIVYAGMGAGIYFYSRNNKQYKRYRNAYKRRLAGFTDDEFTNQATGEQTLSNDALIDAQKFYSKNKDLSLLVTGIFYILNIVDANVSAHLAQFNVNENLSLRPDFYQNEIDYKPNLGLTLNYQF